MPSLPSGRCVFWSFELDNIDLSKLVGVPCASDGPGGITYIDHIVS